MTSDTAKYYALHPDRKRYRAVVRIGSGRLVIARGTYSGMLEAEREVSNWVTLLNHIYPGSRMEKIQRVKNGTS